MTNFIEDTNKKNTNNTIFTKKYATRDTYCNITKDMLETIKQDMIKHAKISNNVKTITSRRIVEDLWEGIEAMINSKYTIHNIWILLSNKGILIPESTFRSYISVVKNKNKKDVVTTVAREEYY